MCLYWAYKENKDWNSWVLPLRPFQSTYDFSTSVLIVQLVSCVQLFFFLIILFILTVQGLACCVGLSLVVGSGDYPPRFLDSRAQAQYLWHMGLAAPWHAGPSWVIEPMSPALAGGCLPLNHLGSSVSNYLGHHEPHHTRLPCPSPSPGACSNSCPLSWWFHPTISSSVTLLLLPSVFPSIKFFSSQSALRIRWPRYWSFSFLRSFQWILRVDSI